MKEAAFNKKHLTAKKLTTMKDHQILNQMDIPNFGLVKCAAVVTAFNSLEQMLKAPPIMALGARGLSKEHRKSLYALLLNEEFRSYLEDCVKRRNSFAGTEDGTYVLQMGLFDFQPVLWELLGATYRGRLMHVVIKRWQKAMIPLGDCLIRQQTLTSKIPDELHWDLKRIMANSDRQRIAASLDEYRYVFRIQPH